MNQAIEGISAETVAKVSYAFRREGTIALKRHLDRIDAPCDRCMIEMTEEAITALLASGEVVLRSDVMEIIAHVGRAHVALHNCETSEMLDYAHEEIHKVFEIEKRMK